MDLVIYSSVRGTDGGNTFSSMPMLISDNLGGSSDPQIAASGSNVYVVWRQAITSTTSEIIFSKGTDGGNNFSIPFDISQIVKHSFSPQISYIWKQCICGMG